VTRRFFASVPVDGKDAPPVMSSIFSNRKKLKITEEEEEKRRRRREGLLRKRS